MLQVVSEKLSHHVIQNYDKFVAGVEEVTGVEVDLAAAHVTTKVARERLALALREVGGRWFCLGGEWCRRWQWERRSWLGSCVGGKPSSTG